MKRKILILMLIFGLMLFAEQNVAADWWERSEVRPTQPSLPRNIPTSTPQPTRQPTSVPTQPTVTTAPPIGGLPTSTPTPVSFGTGGTSDDDPCAAGKSYTGPYCGWSPEKDKSKDENGGGPTDFGKGGPEIMGLSYTGSGDLTAFDIILLTGVLCLLLYARSKMLIVKARH